MSSQHLNTRQPVGSNTSEKAYEGPAGDGVPGCWQGQLGRLSGGAAARRQPPPAEQALAGGRLLQQGRRRAGREGGGSFGGPATTDGRRRSRPGLRGRNGEPRPDRGEVIDFVVTKRLR